MGRRLKVRAARHLGRRTWTGAEVSLGSQLRIDLDDRSAGKPELCGEGTRGRQHFVRGEASTPDSLSQSIFERCAPAPPRGKVKVQVDSVSRLVQEFAIELDLTDGPVCWIASNSGQFVAKGSRWLMWALGA